MSRKEEMAAELLEWRRAQVIKLYSQGLTIDEIAAILQVSPRTIKRDHAYIKQHSKEVLQTFLVETLPMEISKALARLNAVSDYAWKLVRQAEKDKNDKLYTEALRLAKDVANDITDIVTNNRSLIDAAYEHVDIVVLKRDEKEEEEEQLGKLSRTSKESIATTTASTDPEAVF